MKWKRGLTLITSLVLIFLGMDKFIDIIPNPILSLKAQELLKVATSVGYIIPFIGFVQISTGVALFFKRATPLGALMFFPLSITMFVLYLALTPSAVFLSLYLFVVSCTLIYDNRAFYSPILLSLSNGKRITFMQLKRSHFIEE